MLPGHKIPIRSKKLGTLSNFFNQPADIWVEKSTKAPSWKLSPFWFVWALSRSVNPGQSYYTVRERFQTLKFNEARIDREYNSGNIFDFLGKEYTFCLRYFQI